MKGRELDMIGGGGRIEGERGSGKGGEGVIIIIHHAIKFPCKTFLQSVVCTIIAFILRKDNLLI